ncbi:MAG: serine/threonine protein kinase [Desulfobulbus sp.]|jgi:Ser/Thr protein kinase RdoA (MazF antagonist)|uniref:serine/threonine protein kinase n=1 Tax=Desulfobulbus sp. TaxID=895 RepID=UPI0028448DA9|nr:serine/threonine protein kinase [Desulfobulbus sp.]MDR2550426.1 serine/threonine protein kinase [Desulfobulbus sp.]
MAVPSPSTSHAAFHGLTPERILEAVETALGTACTNLCRPCNSYINRVYELESTAGDGLIAKFYRPGRWPLAMIQDEHDFLCELADEEIPVVAPLPLRQGGTIGRCGAILFAVFPKKGGRAVDEFTEDQWLAVGRLLGRMHMVGARNTAAHRFRLHPATTTTAQAAYIRESGLVPADLLAPYTRTVDRLIAAITPLFSGLETIRIHGDCHFGNLVYRPESSFLLIDFDDMVIGPPVQDFWMLLPGRLDDALLEADLLIEGYETFRPFVRSTLRLIEPLRAMRFIHYSAWCAHQVVEDGATAVVPDFGSPTYWRAEIDDLDDQLKRIEQDSRLAGNLWG